MNDVIMWAKENSLILFLCAICILFAGYSLMQLQEVNDQCNEQWIEQLKDAGMWDKYKLEIEYEVMDIGNKSYYTNGTWQFNNS